MSHVMMPIDNFFRLIIFSGQRRDGQIGLPLKSAMGRINAKSPIKILPLWLMRWHARFRQLIHCRKAALAFAPIIVSNIFLAGLQPMLLAKYGCR